MTAAEIEQFEQQIYSYVGRECGSSTAHDSVNQAMIRQWCEVMGNHSPAHLDPEWAAGSSRGHLVAPATMLFAWTQEGYSVTTRGRPMNAQVELVQLFDKHGYFGTVATDTTQEYLRELELGDVVHERTIIDNISPRKETGRGVGYFYETASEFTDQNGELVGRQTFRVLKFMPPAKEGQ